MEMDDQFSLLEIGRSFLHAIVTIIYYTVFSLKFPPKSYLKKSLSKYFIYVTIKSNKLQSIFEALFGKSNNMLSNE